MFAARRDDAKAKEYVSPDGSLFLPAGRVFRQGPDDSYPGMDPTGWRWSQQSRRLRLHHRPAAAAASTSRAAPRTAPISATVQADGTLADLQPFAERGGESVAADSAGNVYVANGQIFVYDRDGKQIGRIDVPERPMQSCSAGRIAARCSS